MTQGTPQTADNPAISAQFVNSATVTLGEVSVENDAKFADPNENDEMTIFDDYRLSSRYEKDYHRYMMGISSPGGFQGASVAFVQLASPTLLLVVEWTVTQWSKQPPIPKNTIGSDWVLLDEGLITKNVLVGANGVTPRYRISGQYVYGHKNPSAVIVENIEYSRPPWVEDVFDRTQPASTLTESLINKKGQQAATGGKPPLAAGPL